MGLTNTTVPFVTLSLDAEWAHLSGIRPVWIDRGEVVAVRSVRASLPPSGHGVRFDTEDGVLDGVVFWTLSVDTVLDAFASHGWPVEPL